MSDFTRFDQHQFTNAAIGASVGAASALAASAVGAIIDIRRRAALAAIARHEAMEAHHAAAIKLTMAHIDERRADQELRAALEDEGIAEA